MARSGKPKSSEPGYGHADLATRTDSERALHNAYVVRAFVMECQLCPSIDFRLIVEHFEIGRRWNRHDGWKRQCRFTGAVLFVTTCPIDVHWRVYFVRHVLRAQRAACQAPDDHVLESRLARPVEAANQSDIPVDLDDEVLRILTVQPAMPVQTTEAVRLDAP